MYPANPRHLAPKGGILKQFTKAQISRGNDKFDSLEVTNQPNEQFGGFQEDPTCKNIIIQLTSYPIKQVLRKKVLILGYLFKICRGK